MNLTSKTLRTAAAAALTHRARAATVGAAAAVGAAALVGTLGLVVVAAPPALAASGGGTATGTSQALGHQTTTCAVTTSLTFVADGTGTYTATMGGRSATYSGPVHLTLAKTPPPGRTGPFGTKGYSCSSPPGTPFDATATTTGSDASGSVSCTYTGTISRVNPELGNGTDRASAVLSGTCTVREGHVVVSDSPTTELRTIKYVLNSCTGGPAPNFACANDTTFTASNLVTGTHTGPLVIGTGSTIITGATIDGPVVVEPGASVSVADSQINGALRSTGATSLSVCASHVAGPVLVTGSRGSVVLGDAADDTTPACAPDTIAGPLALTHNTGGVEVGADTITGPLVLVANTGAGPSSENAAPEVEANHVGGPLVCAGNSPAPTEDAQANTLGGPATGQCSAMT